MKGNGWVWGSDLLILSPILRIPGCWDITIFGIFSFCLLSIHLLSFRLATKRVLVNRNETEAAPTIITNLRARVTIQLPRAHLYLPLLLIR